MSNLHHGEKSDLNRLWTASTRHDRVVLGTLLVAMAAATLYLWPFWRGSPELSHGYFGPVCAVALLWQSRKERNLVAAWRPATAVVWQSLLLLAGIFAGGIAALAALAQGPLHPQTAFLTGITLSLVLLSGILALARSPTGGVRANGASLGAALLWWAVVPLPNGTLSRVTLFLQDVITAASVKTLHLLGYPALRHGNIIELPNALVGVEEACSGIRSLTACLFAGLVLGGLMLNGLPRRGALVVGAALMAIVANFFRSIALCLMTAQGVEIKGFWHDATAYGVLGATTVTLFAACALLGRDVAPDAPELSVTPPRGRSVLNSVHSALAAMLALLVGAVILKVNPPATFERPPPDLQALLVIDNSEWRRRTDESIFAFRTSLHTPWLRQESYFRGDTQLTFYCAYWSSDLSTLGSVALHTPDMCLPGGGWSPRPVPAASANYPLESPRRFAFEQESYPQFVWFWHFYDGRPMGETNGLSPWQLGPLLLKAGVRVRSPQWVIRVSSNKPLESLLHEAILQEFFARLRKADLAGS